MDSNVAESVSGVPSYPLYRAVAQALYQSFRLGGMYSREKNVALLREEASVKQLEDWNKLIVLEGDKLVDVSPIIGFFLFLPNVVSEFL